MFHNKLLRIFLSIILLSVPFQSTQSAPYRSDICRTKVPKRYFGICGSSGPVIFAVSVNQGAQNATPPYTGGLGGGGFFLEGDFYGVFKAGVALSGFIMRVDAGPDPVNVSTRTKIVSGAPAVYGGFNYNGAFVYVTLATGILKYSTSRTIRIANLIAQGNFEARQNSYRGRIGYAAPFGNLEITPMATVDNVTISKGMYTETGAGAFNLTVRNGVSSASQSAFGARFAEISEPEIFYPEVHFFATSDSNTTGNKLRVVSRFLDGIPPIVLQGNTPGSTGYNIGGSISTSTILGKNVSLVATYDYEARQKGYTSHSFYVRFLALF